MDEVARLRFLLAHAEIRAAAERTAVQTERFIATADPDYPAYLAERAAAEHTGDVPPSREVFDAERAS